MASIIDNNIDNDVDNDVDNDIMLLPSGIIANVIMDNYSLDYAVKLPHLLSNAVPAVPPIRSAISPLRSKKQSLA